MIPALRVLRPGMLTTVQDLGRTGWQHAGVPVGGAMDLAALRLANLLAGNDEGAAALEMTLAGATLEALRPLRLALAGGDFDATLDGAPVGRWRAFDVRAGAVLALGAARAGCRVYLAVRGGLAVPPVLGSRSTCLVARFGGHEGRALRKDDVLVTDDASFAPRPARALAPDVRPRHDAPVRLIVGGDAASLGDDARRALFDAEWEVAPESDRMGIRLAGPALALRDRRELPSAGVAFGTVQLPPGGQPIVLMADRQTTGGYPTLGVVASADLPTLAQRRPGDRVRFAPCTVDEAEAAYIARERPLRALAFALRHAP